MQDSTDGEGEVKYLSNNFIIVCK